MNRFSGSTLSMQNAKLRCFERRAKFFRLFPQSCDSKDQHVRQSGKENCYLAVKSVPICCKILLGDVRRMVVAFSDDKIHVTGFLAIILNAA